MKTESEMAPAGDFRGVERLYSHRRLQQERSVSSIYGRDSIKKAASEKKVCKVERTLIKVEL